MLESFQPLCPRNEVILMKSATYGRMRIGRCITSEEVDGHRSAVGEDPRYFGCSADVLHILDRKCSGKAGCEARMSDISSENIKPCFLGLTVSLEVSYECISGKLSIFINRKFTFLTQHCIDLNVSTIVVKTMHHILDMFVCHFYTIGNQSNIHNFSLGLLYV